MEQIPKETREWMEQQLTRADWLKGKESGEISRTNSIISLLQSQMLLDLVAKRLSEMKTTEEKKEDIEVKETLKEILNA